MALIKKRNEIYKILRKNGFNRITKFLFTNLTINKY